MHDIKNSGRLIAILAIALLAGTLLSACGTQASSQSGTPGVVSFSQDVLPILQGKCSRCHGDSRQSGGLNLSSYTSMMTGGRTGASILPGDAANSLLVQMVSSGKMPKSGLPLSNAQIQTITEWVNSGALDN
jgi:cytochrome c